MVRKPPRILKFLLFQIALSYKVLTKYLQSTLSIQNPSSLPKVRTIILRPGEMLTLGLFILDSSVCCDNVS